MKRSMTREIILGAVCYQEYSGAYLDFLELAAELRLSWVEFKYEPPLCYRDGSRRYLDIRKQADDFGIGMSMHTAFDGLNIASLEDEERIRSLDTVKESIDAAAQMGISLATLHAGYLSSVDYSPERWSASREININSIRELIGFARERGVTLCLENGNAFEFFFRFFVIGFVYCYEGAYVKTVFGGKSFKCFVPAFCNYCSNYVFSAFVCGFKFEIRKSFLRFWGFSHFFH